MYASAPSNLNKVVVPSGDKYEHPSPQIIYVRQTSPYISISVPLLQQYYINLTRKNQDYGYFQITYYDFPLSDSPETMIGSTLGIAVVFTLGWLNGVQQYQSLTIPSISIDLTGVRTLPQFVEQLKTAIFDVFSKYQLGLAPEYNGTILEQVAAQFTDIFFDDATQKIVFQLAPSPKAAQNQVGGFNINYMKIRFQRRQTPLYAEMSDKQFNYARLLLGGGTLAQNELQTDNELLSQVTTPVSEIGLPIYAYQAMITKIVNPASDFVNVFDSFTAFSVFPKYASSMTNDPYIYIRGGPEAQIWNSDGTSSDIAAIVPRNRQVNQTVTLPSSFLTQQTNGVKAPLNSMRVMQMYLTDKDGKMVQFEDEFTMMITVRFDID